MDLSLVKINLCLSRNNTNYDCNVEHEFSFALGSDYSLTVHILNFIRFCFDSNQIIWFASLHSYRQENCFAHSSSTLSYYNVLAFLLSGRIHIQYPPIAITAVNLVAMNDMTLEKNITRYKWQVIFAT
jgi:hypothetical protein